MPVSGLFIRFPPMSIPIYAPGIEINAPVSAEFAQILTPEAMALVAKLHRTF